MRVKPFFSLNKVEKNGHNVKKLSVAIRLAPGPGSGEKSTGLGLNFVMEVVTLHKGDIKLENRAQKGVRATLINPT